MRELSIGLVVAISLAAGACDKKGASTASTGSAAGGASAAPGSAAGSATGSAAGSDVGSAGTQADAAGKVAPIDCAKVIPQSAVDTYFKGSTPKHNEPVTGYSDVPADTTCRFVYDEKANKKILIDYSCGSQFEDLDGYLSTVNEHLKTKLKKVPGIGRGGFTDSVTTYGVQHRSLPCMIMVDLAFLADNDALRKQDYMALLRVLEAALPDAS